MRMKPPEDLEFLPPHEPTVVRGLHAYSHRLSVTPGDELDLRVSGEGPVEIEIVRYGYNRRDATVVAALGRFDCAPQPVFRGDYIYVARPVPVAAPFTIELWVRVLDTRVASGLLAQADVALVVEAGGALALQLGGGVHTWVLRGPVLAVEIWHHIVVVVTETEAQLYVDGVRRAGKRTPRRSGAATEEGAPLVLGARYDAVGRACGFLTGDLFGPAIYGRALGAEEIARRHAEVAYDPAAGCLARWAFDDRGGVPYRDSTGHGHDGRPVNYPTRMIPGPRIRENADWQTFDPARDTDFGYAVRLFRDTLVDCRWPVTARWRVPGDLRSGQYAARVTNGAGEARLVDFIASPTEPGARLMCISTTNTRIAYNFESFRNQDLDCGAYKEHASYALRGTFNGVRRPAGGDWYGHTVDFELPFCDWLARQKIACDVYTEWALEERPELAEAYGTIAIAGHSEYWTADLFQILWRFVERGGHLLLMTGNTGFWRVTPDRRNQVIEIRKHERKAVLGTDNGPMIDAAYFQQLDGRPGSYMHWGGYPVYALTGGFSTGFTDPPIHGPRAGYTVLQPEHPLFREPHRIDTAGVFAADAAGYETDISMRHVLERFGNPRRAYYPHLDGTPPPALETDFDAGLEVLARATIPGKHYTFDYDVEPGVGPMGAEMMYRRWPSGGSVFQAGSVLAAWPLNQDENYSRFMLNVLAAMGVGSRG